MKIVGNVTKEQADQVSRTVERCILHLSKPVYRLGLPSNAVEVSNNVLEVKKRKNTSCRAGANLIRINLGYWQIGNDMYVEYARFNNDPQIGKTPVTDTFDHLLLIISHEVCHHVQYRYMVKHPLHGASYKKPHGEGFQHLYRIIRKDMVNPIIRQKMIDKARGTR